MEDTHFYIDYAPCEDVRKALTCLGGGRAMTASEVFDELQAQGRPVKSPRTETIRRLSDLGLAAREELGNRVTYTITKLGEKVRDVDALDLELYPDVMHFLHFSSYDGSRSMRKYLWSYRRCSELAWIEGRLLPLKEIAARIQSQMNDEFPDLDSTAQIGARFDNTAAGRWAQWVRALRPPPFTEGGRVLQKRTVLRHELGLLALDDAYRTREYRYGDPVILDEVLLDEVARVFFLDPVCCRQLIDLAARVTKAIELRDTLAGTSVTLLAAYGIDRI
jgi:hypothetical protein